MTSEHPLSGVSGGSDYNSNNIGDDGNGRDKKQRQKEKPEYSTFKYSTRLTGPLHEAIMLGSEPFFLTYSKATGSFDLVRKIEEVNRILVPPYPEEYPYDPVEFTSRKELQEYFDLAANETIDSLYQRVKGVVILYVDQDEEVIILISADIIWTFFQDLYSTTHYDDVTGKENGIGKSSIGYMFEAIGYRGVRMTDPSAANLYRILGKIEPGQCTLVMDEADRVHQDKDMLSILKEGYAIGGKVSKINTNSLKQEFFYPYGFKIRIAEESLRDNITKGVIDRSFQIKASKGRPTHDIKEVLQPANRNERLGKLHNDLKSLRKLLLAYRLVHFSDKHDDIQTGLEGRDKELCKPLLHLFYGSKAYNEVRETLQTFLDRKNKRKKNTAVEPLVYAIVIDLVSRLGTEIPTSQVWGGIISDTIIRGSYDPRKPNEYQSQDYGIIYRNAISKIVYDNFGAEPKHRNDGNAFVFDVKKLAKAGKAYDIEANIQVKLDEADNDKDKKESEASEASEVASNPSGSDKHEESLNLKAESDNISNNDPKNSETLQEMNEIIPGIGASPASPIPNIYRRYSDHWGCHDCNAKGDRHYLERHDCKGQDQANGIKSKVADMAAANESVNGITGYNISNETRWPDGS